MGTQTLTSDRDYQKSTSYNRHKKQWFWQILVPVGFTGLLLLAVAVLIVITALNQGGAGAISQGADASLIWLIIPMMLFALMGTLVLIALVILIAKTVHILPHYTFEAQRYVTIFSTQIRLWADKLVSPMIAVESASTRLSAFFSALFGQTRV